jgi:hypothetical protein
VYSYDGDGNLLTQTNPSGSIVSYAYNPNGQACVEYMGSLTSPSCASPPSGATSYTYDADGRRHTMTDSTGTSTWTDDALDEVTSVQNGADKTLSYGYNVDGDLVCMGYPVSGAATCPVDSTGSGSGIVTYGYDGIDRMTSMTDWLSSPNETHFAYDADSNVTGVTYSSASGATASYVYNGADMMTEASVSVGSGDNPHGAALSDSWGYDPEEQVSSDTDTGADYVYDAQGRLANSNVYYGDSLNDELCWTDTSSTTATCASPPSGSGVETFAYNGDSELTSTTESSGTTDYGYTPDGERCFEGDASGTCSSPPSGALTYGWNALGHMCWSDVTSASTSCGSPPTGATSYDYNGDGLLTTSSSSGSTSLTWDEVGDSLPRIVSDGSKAYLYGPDMFGVGTTQPIEEITLSSSAPAFVFADRVGTKLLLSSLGVVNASFSYSDWGVETGASWNSSSIPFSSTATTRPDREASTFSAHGSTTRRRASLCQLIRFCPSPTSGTRTRTTIRSTGSIRVARIARSCPCRLLPQKAKRQRPSLLTWRIWTRRPSAGWSNEAGPLNRSRRPTPTANRSMPSTRRPVAPPLVTSIQPQDNRS